MRKLIFLFVSLFFLIHFGLNAQLLEPRLLTNLPVGTNFIIAGYTYTTGTLAVDPAFPVEDLSGKVNSFAFGYLRSLRVGNESGKISIVVPYASGKWTGVLDGVDSARNATGFGDLNIRFSYNFFGSPAMEMKDYANFKQNWVSGFSIQVFFPTGNYDNTHAINLGTNRYKFRTILGASKLAGKWIFEFYGGIWFFTANKDFLNGNTLYQRPLGAFKIHVIRTLPRGNWITLDGGYGFGGKNLINGEPKNVRISTFRFGFTIAIPFRKKHNIRLTGYSGRRLQEGPDFDGFGAFYQYRWNK